MKASSAMSNMMQFITKRSEICDPNNKASLTQRDVRSWQKPRGCSLPAFPVRTGFLCSSSPRQPVCVSFACSVLKTVCRNEGISPSRWCHSCTERHIKLVNLQVPLTQKGTCQLSKTAYRYIAWHELLGWSMNEREIKLLSTTWMQKKGWGGAYAQWNLLLFLS